MILSAICCLKEIQSNSIGNLRQISKKVSETAEFTIETCHTHLSLALYIDVLFCISSGL